MRRVQHFRSAKTAKSVPLEDSHDEEFAVLKAWVHNLDTWLLNSLPYIRHVLCVESSTSDCSLEYSEDDSSQDLLQRREKEEVGSRILYWIKGLYTRPALVYTMSVFHIKLQ